MERTVNLFRTQFPSIAVTVTAVDLYRSIQPGWNCCVYYKKFEHQSASGLSIRKWWIREQKVAPDEKKDDEDDNTKDRAGEKTLHQTIEDKKLMTRMETSTINRKYPLVMWPQYCSLNKIWQRGGRGGTLWCVVWWFDSYVPACWCCGVNGNEANYSWCQGRTRILPNAPLFLGILRSELCRYSAFGIFSAKPGKDTYNTSKQQN